MENKVFSDQFGTHDMFGWLGEKTELTTNYVTTIANSAVQSLYIGENGLAFNRKYWKVVK